MKVECIKKLLSYEVWLILFITCAVLLGACGEKSADNSSTADVSAPEEVNDNGEPESTSENNMESDRIEDYAGRDVQETPNYAAQNEERFYECARMLEVDRAEAQGRYQRLCNDDVFLNQTARLVGVDIEDLDRNGQLDMVVMVQETEYNYYGEGCIYFYMNEDAAYCFRDEEYPFFFGFHIVSGDFDHDGNTEIAFESLGTGVGGAGDWHPRILKYRDHTMEPMDFPADDYDGRGICIVVTQEEERDTYSAYCTYLDDMIVFEAKNIYDPDTSRPCGGNSRGYFNLWRGEYRGKDALEVSEILYGESGIAHGLGLAKFLIVWDENGNGEIVKWWVEPYEED